MKKFLAFLPSSCFILLLSLFILISCKNSGTPNSDPVKKADTTYVPRIDTIVIFNPDSPDVETIRIIESVDTIISQ